jgi:hypothetical protein
MALLHWYTLIFALTGLSQHVQQTAAAKPGILSFPLKRHVFDQHTERPLKKRNGFTSSLKNEFYRGMYSINITVGTPGQPVMLSLDTGSGDLWVRRENILNERLA